MNAVPLLHDYLETAAATRPQAVGLVFGEERWTYAELEAAANAVASTLREHGVGRGERVVVFLESSSAAVVAFWGVLKANAVVVMVGPNTRLDKLAYMMSDCQAVAVISHPSLCSVWVPAALRTPSLKTLVLAGECELPPALAGIAVMWSVTASGTPSAPPRRALDIDLASIIYTSGSTGEPKGVMLTHRNMLTAATSISTYLGNVADDVILCALPLSFDYGLYQNIMSVRAGACLVLEKSFAYPARIVELVAKEQVTAFPGVPTLFALLAELKDIDTAKLDSVRYVTNTAAALLPKHIGTIRRLFTRAKVFSMYGLTECKRCTYLPPEDIDKKPGSVGVAIPNTEIWIVDEVGNRLGPGQLGQLVVRGATVMRGYWNKPEATAKKLKPGPLPGEQVLYTGDLCKLDADGYLYFVGRMDDVIKSRGEKVAPKEVEAAVCEVPGVAEVAVIGIDDALLGQAVCAFVVCEAGVEVSRRDVIESCRGRLEPYQVPKYVEFLPAFPRTANGKIDRPALAARHKA